MAEEQDPPQGEPVNSNVASLAEAARKKASKKKRAMAQPPEGDDGRPIIKIQPGQLPEMLTQADAALAAHDLQLFDQFGRLVRITEGARATSAQGRVEATLLMDATVPHLCDRLARVARWVKYDARANDWITSNVPKAVAESLLARSGEWQKIPKLRGFVESPTLRDDGSLLERPGYDAASQLYFSGGVPEGYSMPQETREHALDAVEQLQDLLFDIPFVGKEDQAAAIAGILTALVRRVLPSAPMLGITAPSPGTGKSLVADVISIIATGHRAGVLGFGSDEVEGDKRLTGALLAGDAVITIDNIERPMFGDLICQALTQPIIRIRPLGSAHLISTPTNTVIVATANNLDVRGDLKRRVILIRLDAKTERPELRHFDRNLLQEAAKRRGEMVRAALTIIRSYLRCGLGSVKAVPFGSFEHWSKWCREPLIWLGFPDPLLASDLLREQDPDLVAQRQLFAAWVRVFGQEDITANDIIRQSELAENSDLRGALDTVCTERIAARRLGYWLRKHRNRVFEGNRLEGNGFTRAGLAIWRLVRL